MKKINEKLETSIDQKIFEERYGPLPPGMFPEIKEEEDESQAQDESEDDSESSEPPEEPSEEKKTTNKSKQPV